MAEQENADTNLPTTWSDTIQSIAEGGLPQIIAGPAGKAISRLIGSVVEIPASWFDQKAQGIRDETEARSKMMQTLAEKSAELGLADPKLLHRGLDNMLGRAYREQTNREAVAGKAVEQLRIDPPPLDGPGPSDDWLNVFEDHASKASSEWVRENWARVLAGEIRKPGSFSLQTLAFLAQLDQQSAIAVEEALTRVVDGTCAIIGEVGAGEFSKLNLARSLGIIHQLDTDSILSKKIAETGRVVFSQNGACIVAIGVVGTEIQLKVVAISRVGKELHSVLRPQPTEDTISTLIEQVKKITGVKSIERGSLETRGDQRFAIDLNEVWARENAAP